MQFILTLDTRSCCGWFWVTAVYIVMMRTIFTLDTRSCCGWFWVTAVYIVMMRTIFTLDTRSCCGWFWVTAVYIVMMRTIFTLDTRSCCGWFWVTAVYSASPVFPCPVTLLTVNRVSYYFHRVSWVNLRLCDLPSLNTLFGINYMYHKSYRKYHNSDDLLQHIFFLMPTSYDGMNPGVHLTSIWHYKTSYVKLSQKMLSSMYLHGHCIVTIFFNITVSSANFYFLICILLRIKIVIILYKALFW